MADVDSSSKRKASSEARPAAASSPLAALPPLPPELQARGQTLVESLTRGDNVQQAFDAFCSAAYVKPDWAGAASEFLAELFEPHEDLLAEMARIPDLIIELATGHITMTCLVAARWAARGETARMARLAEALIATQSKMSGPEVVDVMLALASSLAISRHSRAEQLFAFAEPHATEEQQESVFETRLWLGAGRIIRSCTHEARELWDQRLRRSRHPWTWESEMERDALLQLADQLEEGIEGATLFRAVVPPSWWDLAMVHARERAEAQAVSRPTPPPPPIEPAPVAYQGPFADHDPEPLISHRNIKPFLVGAAVGVAAALLMGWIFSPNREETPSPPAEEVAAVAPSSSPAPAPAPTPVPASGDEVPPMSLEAPGETQHPNALWRQEQADLLAAESPELALVISGVKEGNWADNELLLRGRSPLLPKGSVQHERVLRWLLLDPPDDADARAQVPLLFADAVGGSLLIDLWERLVYPGSANAKDIQTAARELLKSRPEEWSEEESRALQNLISTDVAGIR